MAEFHAPSSHQTSFPALELPTPSFPGRRTLLRGAEISLYCDTPPPLTLAEHTHTQVQISFQSEPACCTIVRRVNDTTKEQRLHGRHVSCIAPNVPHGFQWEVQAPFVAVYIEPAFLARLPRDDVTAVLGREALPSATSDPVLWLLIDTLRQLCHETHEPSPKLLEPILTALGRRVFLRHGQNAPTPNGNGLSPSRLQRVLEHIQGHLAAHLDVRTLAQLVALSPAHFTEVFRASTGYTPMEYVREQRHLKAHALALAGEHRYGEIADLCGFADVSHLNREFKKFFGYPARLLRRRWTVM